MAIAYGPSKALPVQGEDHMSCQHSMLCSGTLLKGPGKIVCVGRTEIRGEQGRAVLVGWDSKQCVGRGGREKETPSAEVSTETTGLLTPGGYASRSTTLHLGQNWGRAAVAVLREVAR